MLAACGGKKASPKGLSLQREHLALVSHELERVHAEAAREVAATRGAWPLIYAGLPRWRSGIMRPQIATAVQTAETLTMPALFHGGFAAALTGQGSSLAALYRSYVTLTTRAWAMIGAYIYQLEHGTRRGARFARENVNLYIETVYDSHFSLAQIGKKLARAYAKLGGERAFGATLTQAQVDALASQYSEAQNRLYPHVKAKFGS